MIIGLALTRQIKPIAQFREKAVFQYTTHPLLSYGKYYYKRWKTQ